MKEIEECLFEFDCTKRKFSTHGMSGISIDDIGSVTYGRDGYVDLIDEEGYDDADLEFTDEEKKELAIYMMDKWAEFGGLKQV